MNDPLGSLLAELERFGADHDHATAERSRRMLNITRDTGEFLSVVVRAMSARRVLEIGTSNGYSTLWLASAASETGGTVITVECSDHKFDLARLNFNRSGLAGWITLVRDDAGRVLAQAQAASFDFVFLDADRAQYVAWWPDLKRALRPGGLLVVDNATSHAAEMAAFVGLVQSDAQFTTSLVPLGNGEFLAVKSNR
jgi:predicted O-methyltransferase YrrM